MAIVNYIYWMILQKLICSLLRPFNLIPASSSFQSRNTLIYELTDLKDKSNKSGLVYKVI